MIKGIIFDMDGVVTNTATIHFKAWKVIIDQLLFKLNPCEKNLFTENDYFNYLDGISRSTGITNFLNSRNITATELKKLYKDINQCIIEICNNKNTLLLSMLAKNKVKYFEDTLEFIKFLLAHNYRIALISSSKNCAAILQSAEINTVFPVRVDGTTAEQLGLEGKPSPDIFLEAARRLGLLPQECLIVEDALAGVKAAKEGNFGAVIALDRNNKLHSKFESLGADYILPDLSSKHILLYKKLVQFSNKKILHGLEAIPLIYELTKNNHELIVFLDYDGTLTPIVERPEHAVLPLNMHECLSALSKNYRTVIISGRELFNIKKLVNIPNIYYFGNHGLELEGPKHSDLFHQIGHEFLESLNTLYQKFKEFFKNIKGCIVENKKFSLSIHYRLVEEHLHEYISQKIDDQMKKYPQLTRHAGKKVFEVRPNIKWNKGIAAAKLLNQFKTLNPKVIPIYIGDDVSDEDAFTQFAFNGLTIKVTSDSKKTNANYLLKSPQEVHTFLNYLNKFKEVSHESMDNQLQELQS